MKFLKLFSILLFVSVSCMAQKIQLKTTTGPLFNYGAQSTLSTTDASYHTIDQVTPAANSAGVLEVSVVGVNTTNGDAITGSQIVRFKKASGTLTLGTPADILALVTDSGLSGGTWDISASSNNIIVRVKGKASTSVRWRCLIKQVQ